MDTERDCDEHAHPNELSRLIVRHDQQQLENEEDSPARSFRFVAFSLRAGLPLLFAVIVSIFGLLAALVSSSQRLASIDPTLDRATLKDADPLFRWLDKAKSGLVNETSGVLEKVNPMDWVNGSSSWAEGEAKNISADALGVWHALQQSTEKEGKWWNQTVQSEEDWRHLILDNLRQFSSKIRSWWHTTTSEVSSKEHFIATKFGSWWTNASHTEKVWWKDTVAASKHIEDSVNSTTSAWWNMVRSTVQEDANDTSVAMKAAWNHSVTDEKLWWAASEEWFRKHRAGESEGLTDLMYLNCTQAYSMLMTDYGLFDFSEDFFRYQSGLDVQSTQAYCGFATAAAVLNSFRPADNAEIAIDKDFSPYLYVTQHSLLHDKCTNDHVVHVNHSYNGVLHAPGGTTLSQVKQLLLCNVAASWSVEMNYVDVKSSDYITTTRAALMAALRDPSSRVLVNYDRGMIGQDQGVHFSPLGSYSPKHDAFLVMDVAKYRYSPVWVPTAALAEAMGTLDSCGDWNFPDAQSRAPVDVVSVLAESKAVAEEKYTTALKQLDCSPSPRGFIVVKSI